MIGKQDILDRAAEWQLRPGVVEKDYVLGWLLAVIGALPATESRWVFKGGTCIKKCYFETYRFSEDLDFTLLTEAAYTVEGLREIATEITLRTQKESGIEFPVELVQVRSQQNKQGFPTFQVRLSYRGPLGGPRDLPRVLFDLTRYEPVQEAPVRRPILHAYPDELPEGASVSTYTFDELLAEKTRALYERTRPRDLYDVVYLLDNQPEAFHLFQTRTLFRMKCSVKGLETPSADQLLQVILNEAELHSEWHNMLGHQLPALPDLDQMLSRLPALLKWIDQPEAVLPATQLAPVVYPPAEAAFAPAGIQYRGDALPSEAIRFAGTNHLLVEFDYHDKHRRAEPYSLRRPATGNLLLYAWEVDSKHIKAFKLAEIRNLRTTNTSFSPRYRIELSGYGTIPPPATHRLPGFPRSSLLGFSDGSKRRPTSRYGPTYVFRCPYCQKEFHHSNNDPALRKHKTQDGYRDCQGRRGYFVRTEHR
jgi:predicted nucleotidyltransferase component of viral defense system